MTKPSSTTTGIPVVDLSPSRNEADVVQELFDALSTVGFCTIINHGFPPQFREDVFAASRAFFSLPVSTKLKYRYQTQASNRGYIPQGAESHLTYVNVDDAKEEAKGENDGTTDFLPTDRKETFDIGLETEAGFNNIWPNQEDLPTPMMDFRTTMLEYFDTMDGLQLKLLRLVGLGLELTEEQVRTELLDKCNGQHENLRLLHYPGMERCDGDGDDHKDDGTTMRGNPHTDFGTLTLLVQDDVGGLKVQRNDGSWIWVEPVEDAIIVNVGDMLMRCTNDKLKATIHQVETPDAVMNSGNSIPERFSVAFFCNFNKDVDLQCLPTCCDPATNPPKYPIVNCFDYITQRLTATIDNNMTN